MNLLPIGFENKTHGVPSPSCHSKSGTEVTRCAAVSVGRFSTHYPDSVCTVTRPSDPASACDTVAFFLHSVIFFSPGVMEDCCFCVCF